MCIIVPSVPLVEGTKIFARRSADSKQFLVYSMGYKASQDVAMILPLPVGSHDEYMTIRFIPLDGYKDFFDHIEMGFPDLTKNVCRSASGSLTVYEVGDYDASFIPTLNDFDRLDPQFKLSRQVWDLLPEYQDYGFAVFKLRESTKNLKKPHPIAFEFVTRLPDKLFFPTVHIHDGKVHEEASFDHHLYYQGDDFANALTLTKTFHSKKIASKFIHIKQTMGIVDGQQRCHAVVMSGKFPNQDTVLSTV
ncbi:hypothetical protein [Leptolyngbya sp. PCC 6406]|uniref:hypothetical protein n=1 Tax=Leptolyngbya sp. PCC 6406 TaxID=1173264 RepID=UPI0002ABBC1D|nr:hypothetical protein [Leptolyngbya sp. PCC 6406]